jgi:hypothetical protein
MIPLPHPALGAFTPQGIKAMSQGINTAISNSETARAKNLLEVLQNPGESEAARAFENGAINANEAFEKFGNNLDKTFKIQAATKRLQDAINNSG